jgi:hypothetical protein
VGLIIKMITVYYVKVAVGLNFNRLLSINLGQLEQKLNQLFNYNQYKVCKLIPYHKIKNLLYSSNIFFWFKISVII